MSAAPSLADLHGYHARALANAAAARRDLARGGAIFNTKDMARRTARLMIDAARNVRVVIAQRKGEQ